MCTPGIGALVRYLLTLFLVLAALMCSDVIVLSDFSLGTFIIELHQLTLT